MATSKSIIFLAPHETEVGAYGPKEIDQRLLEGEFPALMGLRSTGQVRSVAKALFILLLVVLLLMLAVPWQQAVTGKGRVVTYDPNHRVQEIDAPISGFVVNIRDGLVENAEVKKGDILMQIQVIDDELKKQLTAELQSLEIKLVAEQTRVIAYQSYVQAMQASLDQVRLAGTQFIEVARQKLRAATEELKGAEAKWDQLSKNLVRTQRLVEKKIEPVVMLESAVAAEAEAKAKVEQCQSYVKAAEAEVSAKQAELEQKIQETGAKINSASADYEKAQGDVASVEKSVAETRGKQVLQIQPVIAPLDGNVLKLRTFQGGQYVSAGTPLLELVPDAADRAVEIKVDGNDAPLVATRNEDGGNRKVRLQFEGWPAVQFAGWPSVAVGTFGGKVVLVDRFDDGGGKFRVLVVPDPEDRPWPSADILRQGVRANGWVLLNQVPLGMELWRQFNGFPPVVAIEGKSEEKLLRGKK